MFDKVKQSKAKTKQKQSKSNATAKQRKATAKQKQSVASLAQESSLWRVSPAQKKKTSWEEPLQKSQFLTENSLQKIL